MSPAAAQKRPRARRGKSRKRKGAHIRAWLPFLLLVGVTPFAVRAASVLALTGPGALRLLFPWVVLVGTHAPASLAPEQRETLAGWAMWVQFPAYGVVVALLMRWRSFAFGAGIALLLHAGAVLVAALWGR